MQFDSTSRLWLSAVVHSNEKSCTKMYVSGTKPKSSTHKVCTEFFRLPELIRLCSDKTGLFPGNYTKTENWKGNWKVNWKYYRTSDLIHDDTRCKIFYHKFEDIDQKWQKMIMMKNKSSHFEQQDLCTDNEFWDKIKQFCLVIVLTTFVEIDDICSCHYIDIFGNLC